MEKQDRKTIDFFYNIIKEACNNDNVPLQKEASEIGTFASLGSDMMFKLFPLIAFSAPFAAGGLYHIMNNELNAQKKRSKKKIKKLRQQFEEYYE